MCRLASDQFIDVDLVLASTDEVFLLADSVAVQLRRVSLESLLPEAVLQIPDCCLCANTSVVSDPRPHETPRPGSASPSENFRKSISNEVHPEFSSHDVQPGKIRVKFSNPDAVVQERFRGDWEIHKGDTCWLQLLDTVDLLSGRSSDYFAISLSPQVVELECWVHAVMERRTGALKAVLA